MFTFSKPPTHYWIDCPEADSHHHLTGNPASVNCPWCIHNLNTYEVAR